MALSGSGHGAGRAQILPGSISPSGTRDLSLHPPLSEMGTPSPLRCSESPLPWFIHMKRLPLGLPPCRYSRKGFKTWGRLSRPAGELTLPALPICHHFQGRGFEVNPM